MERVRLDKVEVDSISFNDAADYILAITRSPSNCAQQVTTVNAQFIWEAHKDTRLAGLIHNAALSVADGVPLVWASHLLGTALPERVNGTDLMVHLCERAATCGASVYFLGGRPGSANLTADRMLKRFPGLRIVGIDCPPYGFVDDPALDISASERVRRAHPDIVFVALGAPKAEYWIQEHLYLPAKVMIGVGGSFELIGGVIKRAPLPLQKLGCEWVWRLAMEPRRLWKRYLVGNVTFIYLMIRQWLRSYPAASREDAPY